MTQPDTATSPDVPSTLRRLFVPSSDTGLVVIPQQVDGAVVMKLLEPSGEAHPVGVDHSDSGKPLTWAELAVSSREAAVSGWYPGKLGGWVKLDWRDGGFEADAWTSDGSGMTAYDAAMRAAKKRG
jgi:hypothetical protein